MINNLILSGSFLSVELGTLGHQIDAISPNIGVYSHRSQSERGIEKIKSTHGQSSGRG